MSELKICRICLRTEAKVYNYERFQLKSYYEEILALKVSQIDDLPHYFCFECAALLHKFHKFKEKCYLGQKVLKEMLMKGPAGILELLKYSANTTSQESEVIENPFLETDINKTALPVLNNEFNSTDPVEIDSFFANNCNVPKVEKNTENAAISNICSDNTIKLDTFQEPTVDNDSYLTKNINYDMYVKKLRECEPRITSDMPIVNQTFHNSDLGYVEMNLTENLEDMVKIESSSALYCDLPKVSQAFDENNLSYRRNSLDPSTNNVNINNIDLELEKNSEKKHYYDLQNATQHYQKDVINYIESDLNLTEKSNINFNDKNVTENISSSIMNCEIPCTSEVYGEKISEHTDFNENPKNNNSLGFDINSMNTSMEHLGNNLPSQKRNLEFTKNKNFNEDILPLNEALAIFNCTLSNTSETFDSNLIHNETYRDIKGNIASKNQLTSNGLRALPTTSQEYFKTVADSNTVRNLDIDDFLNQLQSDQDCLEVMHSKKKQIRRKYSLSKNIKFNHCHKICDNNCSVRFTEEDRLVIHENYWKMDKRNQQEWLISCMKPKDIKHRQGATFIKNITYDYFINYEDKNIKVCQQFLMKTLDISQVKFRYAKSKLNELRDTKAEIYKAYLDLDLSN